MEFIQECGPDEDRLIALFGLMSEPDRSRFLSKLATKVIIDLSRSAGATDDVQVMVPDDDDYADQGGFVEVFLSDIKPNWNPLNALCIELTSIFEDYWTSAASEAVLTSAENDERLAERFLKDFESCAIEKGLAPPEIDPRDLVQFIGAWRNNFIRTLIRLKALADGRSPEVEAYQDRVVAPSDVEHEGQFELTDEDRYAIQVAKNIAKLLLSEKRTTQRQIEVIKKIIEGLDAIPQPVDGLDCELSVCWRNGNENCEDMEAVSVWICDNEFELSTYGSTYSRAVGGDNIPGKSYRISTYGSYDTELDVSGLDLVVSRYLDRGAKINATDNTVASNESKDES